MLRSVYHRCLSARWLTVVRHTSPESYPSGRSEAGNGRSFAPLPKSAAVARVCIPCGMVTVMVWEVAPSDTSPSSFWHAVRVIARPAANKNNLLITNWFLKNYSSLSKKPRRSCNSAVCKKMLLKELVSCSFVPAGAVRLLRIVCFPVTRPECFGCLILRSGYSRPSRILGC